GAISIPALLAAGLPPHLALGTNKLAATGAAATATVSYVRAGTVMPRMAAWLVPAAAVGAALGVMAVLNVDPTTVQALVIALMAGITVYVLLKKDFGEEDNYEAPSPGRMAVAVGLTVLIGFYDGFLGPGTGSFLIFAYIGVLGFDFLKAAGHGRLMNFTSNIASLAVFWHGGLVEGLAGLPRLRAMMVGGWAGSRFAIKHGSRWIKPLFVVITLALMLKLLYDMGLLPGI
ncbi:MAG: TSUP family transporter, partial [Candidatus Thermoplasmatota archaeon]|nr:TSUP family transporter [Candidatus Thermoplasmatota archaeon]